MVNKSGNYFQPIFPPFQLVWDNFVFFSFRPIFVWGWQKSRNYFQPIFSPFQPIWDNFDFYHFDQMFFQKNLKLISDQIISEQFSSHFHQFGTSLIFVAKFSSSQIFLGGSKNLKLISDQFSRHLS